MQNQLSKFVPNTFLPFLRTKKLQWGRIVYNTVPLFPCYMFGYFDLLSAHHKIIRTVGVIGLVSVGGEPSQVDSSIVEEIRRRGRDGIVELREEIFRQGQAVQVRNGPLSGLNVIFERYISGGDRVAVLLNAVGGADIRVVLSPDKIAPRD